MSSNNILNKTKRHPSEGKHLNLLTHSQISEQQTTLLNNVSNLINRIPQSTKTQKCQTKRNFHQNNRAKENISYPIGMHNTVGKSIDQNERTIKFLSQNTFTQTKQGFCLNFVKEKNKDQSVDTVMIDTVDEMMKQGDDVMLRQTADVMMRQREKIDKLNNSLELIKEGHEKQKQQWLAKQEQYEQQLQQLRRQNNQLKSQAIHSTYLPAKTMQLIDTKLNQQTSQVQEGLQRQVEGDSIGLNQLVARICGKVVQLESELQFFIGQVHQLKEKLFSSQFQLQNKKFQLSASQQQVTALMLSVSQFQIKPKQTSQPPSLTARQIQLITQLNSYKSEYGQLKKNHFLLSQQFTKYTSLISNHKQQSQRFQLLQQQYNCLYQSYKSLYEEYMNKSRQQDFLRQLQQSNRESPAIWKKHETQFDQHSLRASCERLVQYPTDCLEDQKDITEPLESPSQCQMLSSTIRIVLSDLIQETMKTD